MDGKGKRIPGLDLMKLLGLYLVIFYHLTYRQAPEALGHGLKDLIVYAPVPWLSICVPLFFLASGALALRREIPIKRNTLRAAHLLVLLGVWTVAETGLILLLRRESVTFGEFLAIGLEQRVGYIQHLWYLPVFIFLTLTFPVLAALKTGNPKVFCYGVVLVAVFTFGNRLLNDLGAVVLWRLGRHGSGWHDYFWKLNFFTYTYWYALVYPPLGAMVMDHPLSRRRAWGLIAGCAGMLTLVGIGCCRVLGSYFDPVYNSYRSPFTLGITVGLMSLLLRARPPKWLEKIAAEVSRCSLGIYLIHWVLIEVLLDYLPAATEHIFLAPLVSVPVLALSWGITWAGLKIPVLQNLFTAAPKWLKRV